MSCSLPDSVVNVVDEGDGKQEQDEDPSEIKWKSNLNKVKIELIVKMIFNHYFNYFF
jgi:hypothetical protein